MELNEIIEKNSPNFKTFMEQNPEYAKMVKTDTGKYYGYNFIRGDELLLTGSGPLVRKDWLDELNLSVPETMDEWYTVLKAFKEKKGAEAPLSYTAGIFDVGEFIGAYGIMGGFYMEDGQIKYGPMEPEYKDFLTEFAKWYKEGLLDNNIANVDTKALDANILNDRTGATVGWAGSGLGKWLAAKEDDPKFNLVAAPHVAEKKGELPRFGQLDSPYTTPSTAAITSNCTNVELAARLLDYGYSEAGHNLYNFGIEGVSYTVIDGYPTYTDLIMNNPDGLTVSAAMARYIRGSYSGPFVQAREYVEQYYETPQQKEALEVWGKNDIVSTQMPRLTPLPEESSEMAKIMNNVKTHVDEMTLKFITGVESLDNFDQYIETLNTEILLMEQQPAAEVCKVILVKYLSKC